MSMDATCQIDFYEGLVWLIGCQFGKLWFEIENKICCVLFIKGKVVPVEGI